MMLNVLSKMVGSKGLEIKVPTETEAPLSSDPFPALATGR